MVKGIEKFRETFTNYSGNYVIIGGTACDLVLSSTTINPRPTMDIDMVIVAEALTDEYVKKFWAFIKEGEYSCGKRKHPKGEQKVYEMYRFITKRFDYPVKIELLSKHPDILGEASGFHIEPIPVGEDTSSLSAIIMDEDYYNLTINGGVMIDGLNVADFRTLVCLKVKAYLNLLDEKAQGKAVTSLRQSLCDAMKMSYDEIVALISTLKSNYISL